MIIENQSRAILPQGKPALVTGFDGREPAVIGLAAWKSCRENRPVNLVQVDPKRRGN
jgi:hypothetical protein